MIDILMVSRTRIERLIVALEHLRRRYERLAGYERLSLSMSGIRAVIERFAVTIERIRMNYERLDKLNERPRDGFNYFPAIPLVKRKKRCPAKPGTLSILIT